MKPDEKFELIAKELFIAIWFLSGWSNSDYSETTRRDMIEGMLKNLAPIIKDDSQTYSSIIYAVKRAYDGHPLQRTIVECLNELEKCYEGDSMPNAALWMKGR